MSNGFAVPHGAMREHCAGSIPVPHGAMRELPIGARMRTSRARVMHARERGQMPGHMLPAMGNG